MEKKLDRKKLAELAANADLPPELRARFAEAAEQKLGDTFVVYEEETPVDKSGMGVRVPARILDVAVHPMKNGQYTDYELRIRPMSEQMDVAANEGHLVDGNLHLYIRTVYKLTNDTEKAEYKARCEADGITDKFVLKREKELGFRPHSEHEIIVPGRKIKVRAFTGPFGTREGKLGPGDFVWVTLYAEVELESVDGARRPNRYGTKLYTKSITLDKTMDHSAYAGVLRQLVESSAIYNPRPEAGYGVHNQSPEEREFTEKLDSRANQLDKWRVEKSKMAHDQRHLLETPLAMHLWRPDDSASPAQVIRDSYVNVHNLQWGRTWTKQIIENNQVKEEWKIADASAIADVLAKGKPSVTARVLISFYPQPSDRQENKELLDEFGLTNPQRWDVLGRILLAKTEGYLFGKLDLVSTHYDTVNRPDTNPCDANGRYAEGLAYAVHYKAEELHVAVETGVVRGGFRVDRACAEAAFKRVFGALPSRESQHKQLLNDAQRNTLNRRPGTPVLNLFERAEKFSQLEEEGWVFYLLSKFSKDDKMMQKTLTTIRQAEGDDEKRVQAVISDLIRDSDSHPYPFPVSIDMDPREFCVFAVKRSVADELEKPIPAPDEDAYMAEVLRLVEERAKRKSEASAPQPEAKRQAIAPPEPTPVAAQPPPVVAADPLADLAD